MHLFHTPHVYLILSLFVYIDVANGATEEDEGPVIPPTKCEGMSHLLT